MCDIKFLESELYELKNLTNDIENKINQCKKKAVTKPAIGQLCWKILHDNTYKSVYPKSHILKNFIAYDHMSDFLTKEEAQHEIYRRQFQRMWLNWKKINDDFFPKFNKKIYLKIFRFVFKGNTNSISIITDTDTFDAVVEPWKYLSSEEKAKEALNYFGIEMIKKYYCGIY